MFGIAPNGRRSKYYCTYCKVFGHSINRCFKVHGFPNSQKQQFKGKRFASNVQCDGSSDILAEYSYQDSGSYPFESGQRQIIPSNAQPQPVYTQAHQVQAPPVLTHEQYGQLLSLLSSHKMDTDYHAGGSGGPGNKSLAYLAGKCLCLPSSGIHHNWIIDSGATDHITPNLTLFTSYTSLSVPSHITMPNGQKASIAHIGTIKLSEVLTLHDILHVPSFHYNLLSVCVQTIRCLHCFLTHSLFCPGSNFEAQSGPW